MGLSAYSIISMEDGSEKRAEDILIGDRVRDPVSGATASVTRVLNGPGVGMFSVATEDGNILHLTADQEVATMHGNLAVSMLLPGVRLRTAQGESACSEAVMIMGDYNVYDFMVTAGCDGMAHLLANGIAVRVGKG